MVAADGPMGTLTLLKVDRPLLFFQGLVLRSLLSSTDSRWNPVESGQFPEFRGNQFWQRALPIDQMIPPEWFQESPGRNTVWNEMEQNCCLLMTPKLSIGVCQHSIWVSSTNNISPSQLLPLSTTATHLAHHNPTLPTTITDHHAE